MTEYMISIGRVRGRDADGDRETESVLNTYVGDGSQMASAVLQLVAGLLGVASAVDSTRLEPVNVSASDDAFRQQDADRAEREQAAEQQDADGKPKRTRRTKAQIEADKLAEAEAARIAAGGQPTLQPVPAYVPGAVSAPTAQPVDAPVPAQPAYNPFGG
jgi:hypothetical protein